VKLTVAICTYNRADSLADTLEHLCALKDVEGPGWELLLIDNNCRDHTAQVAAAFRERLPMRYMVEENQGLSHGRNRALREAKGDLLIFTDDDVQPEPGWLAAYWRAARRFPEADYFGGRIAPYWPAGKPGWVRDINMPLLGGLFGNYDLGEGIRLYGEQDMHPFGANFGLRRRLFERFGEFRTDLGMRGQVPGRGEEAEYFRRVRGGTQGVYVPKAKILHRVEPSRLTLHYLYRFGVQKGIASRRIHEKPAYGGAGAEVVFLVKGAYQLLRGHGDRFRQCVINMGIQRGLRRKML
jgi:glycosyltransferase involved in cell wall biosynthesis